MPMVARTGTDVFQNSIWHHLLVSAMSTGAATCFTHPIDTCKSRIQLHSREALVAPATSGRKPPSFLREMFAIARYESPFLLFRGLSAALARVSTYSATRIGMYHPFKEILRSRLSERSANGHHQESDPIVLKISAGVLSGSLAAIVGNPFELTKVRMQSTQHKQYKGLIHGLQSIVCNEGANTLWRGVGPSIVRASLLTSSQLVTYDETKRWLLQRFHFEERSLALHLVAGLASGLVSTTVVNPVDVVKTLVMDSTYPTHKIYRHVWSWRSVDEGLFWRGWTANYARIGLHVMITMLVYEQLRYWTGLRAV